MDYCFFKRKYFTNFKIKKKNLNLELLKKESVSDFSKEVKKIFPDAVLIKIEEENKQ